MTKRKGGYRPPNTGGSRRRGGPDFDPNMERPNLATINLAAGQGRAGLSVGDRVRIEASGIYAGEIAVIERLSSGVIPSALVRTEGGGTRQVRTIDLQPAPKEKAPAADKAPAAENAPAAE